MHSWRQYLEFLEKIYPTKTGIKIPESKKPTEFAKHYPEPSSDWPKVPLKFQETLPDETSPAAEESSLQKPNEILAGRIEKVKVRNVTVVLTVVDPGFPRSGVGGVRRQSQKGRGRGNFSQTLHEYEKNWIRCHFLNPPLDLNNV